MRCLEGRGWTLHPRTLRKMAKVVKFAFLWIITTILKEEEGEAAGGARPFPHPSLLPGPRFCPGSHGPAFGVDGGRGPASDTDSTPRRRD